MELVSAFGLESVEALELIALFAPGFVFLKVLYLFGQQHRRLQWEWLVWAAIVGLALAATASLIVRGLAPGLDRASAASAEIVARFGLGAAAGVIAALAWNRVRASSRPWARRLHRFLSDSVWDVVLADATRNRREVWVRVTTGQDGQAVWYYGALNAFSPEAGGHTPWLFLRDPWYAESLDARPRHLEKVHGVLLDGRHVLDIRLRTVDGDSALAHPGVREKEAGDPAHRPALRATGGGEPPAADG